MECGAENVTDRGSQTAELYGEFTFIALGANRTETSQLINWTLISTVRVMYQTRETLFHRDIQTSTGKLKMRRAVQYS